MEPSGTAPGLHGLIAAQAIPLEGRCVAFDNVALSELAIIDRKLDNWAEM
jgi:hypothetical protein